MPAATAAAAKPRAPGVVSCEEQPQAVVLRLLGSLGFASRLESSPYADLLKPELWSDAAHLLGREALGLLGLPLESPLRVAVDAGAIALPTLLKLATVLGAKQSAAWQRGGQAATVPTSDLRMP